MIAAKVATRSRSTARASASRSIVAVRRLRRRDATAERARAAGADVVLELPRGGKVRAQDAGGARRARATCWRSPTPTRRWEPDALRALAARVRRSGGRLRLRPGALRQSDARHQPGGPLLALRDVAARAGVGAGVGHGGQRRDLRACAARPTSRSTPSWATTSRSRSLMVKRGWRAVYVPDGAGDGEDGARRSRASARRKRRMMSHAWPIVLRGGLLDPRGYGAALRADDRLAPRCCATRRRSCTSLALASALPLARRPRLPRGARRPRRAAGGRAGRRARALAAAAGRALLRAHHRLARRRAVDHLRHGTPAGWDAPEGTR